MEGAGPLSTAGLHANVAGPAGGILAKAACFLDFLMQRIAQCASAAALLSKTDRVIPSLMLTRTVAETTIMLFWFHQKSVEFIDTRNEASFERFLMKGTFGSSSATSIDQACTVFMTVDRLDKEARGFKQMFDFVCMCTDTRYDTVLNTSRWNDTRKGTDHLGELSPGDPGHIASELLLACLNLAKEYSRRITSLLAVSDPGAWHPREPLVDRKGRKKRRNSL